MRPDRDNASETSAMSGAASAAASQRKVGPVDAHVHIVGNGSSGSGCWLRVRKGIHSIFARMMVRHIGLPAESLTGDLDELYVENLLRCLRESSLDAAVILAQEIPYDDNGRGMPEKGAMYIPNEYVLGLAKKHPEFLPAISIHPARKDALEALDRCIAGGAIMMKCLPNCQNINCGDRRFIPFWEKMAAAGLPLLAHTGGEHTLPVIRPEYSDPRILKLPLECGVKVIAAHSGTKSGLTDPEYFFVFEEMTRNYPNLYGDNSAFNVPLRGRHTRRCVAEPLARRMIHGSDFPVPVNAHFSWMRGLIDWRTFRRCQGIKNVLERDYQLKQAMGFSNDSFTHIWQLLPTFGLAGG
jgi:predicted TIM-barrel fold metal-dependent hydrolase